MNDVWNLQRTLFNSIAAQTDCKSLTESTLRSSSPMWAGENKQREKKEGKNIHMSICAVHMAAMSLKKNTSKNRQRSLFIQDIMVLVKPSGIQKTQGKKNGHGSDRLTRLVGWTRQWRYFQIRPCVICLCCFYTNAWMRKRTHTYTSSLWAIKKIIGAKGTQSHSFLASSGVILMMLEESDTLPRK